MAKENELLKILLAKGIINQDNLDKIKQSVISAGKSLSDYLIAKKLVDAEGLAQMIAQINKLPYENLIDMDVSDQVFEIIPFEVAQNYKILCFSKSGGIIKIGIVDPENYKATEAINFLAKEENLKVKLYVISQQSFEKIIKQYKNLKKEVLTALERKATEEKKELAESKKDKAKSIDIVDVVKAAPVAKIVSVIIRHAVEGRASDIHIEPMRKESRIRYRIDGVLHTSLILPKNVHSAIVARIKVLASLKLDETRIPQDGRIRLEIYNKEIDFRVSILPTIEDEKVVMRILDVTKGAPSLEELGFSGRSLEVINNNINRTSGMCLVTGPTGSGKSTTLFSLLNILNREGINISTLEDPVEYYINGVNQSQIKPEIGFTFASGLRSFLRQDPDIIMVGEIRDNETAELAIHASLTGHFVFSTLHTNIAIGAIPRLLDMEVEPFLLGFTLNLVVAQRLTRKICQNCKIKVKLPRDIIDDIKKELLNIPKNIIKSELKDFTSVENVTFYKGNGCARCGQSGYLDRIAISEVIEVNDKVKEIIIEDKKMLTLEDIKSTQDFINIKQDGIMKVLKGLTTIEEVLRVVKD